MLEDAGFAGRPQRVCRDSAAQGRRTHPRRSAGRRDPNCTRAPRCALRTRGQALRVRHGRALVLRAARFEQLLFSDIIIYTDDADFNVTCQLLMEDVRQLADVRYGAAPDFSHRWVSDLFAPIADVWITRSGSANCGNGHRSTCRLQAAVQTPPAIVQHGPIPCISSHPTRAKGRADLPPYIALRHPL